MQCPVSRQVFGRNTLSEKGRFLLKHEVPELAGTVLPTAIFADKIVTGFWYVGDAEWYWSKRVGRIIEEEMKR